MRRKTLCSEPVVAFAQTRGFLSGLTRREQFVLWKQHGGEGGALCVALSGAIAEIAPDDASLGDAVLTECVDGAKVLGLRSIGAFSIVAGFGKIHVGRYHIKRAWSLQ